MTEMLPISFAPLQGYTEAIYRNAHAAVFGGVDSYHTPFVRLEKGKFRNRDVRDIEPENNKVPRLIPQLMGHETETIESILALFTEKGYREVDINMGCPFPMLAKRHNGAGILPFPEEVKEVLEVVRRHPEVDFSVKMRLGWEEAGECLRLAPLLNEYPLKRIVVHPRLGTQQYKGEVDLEGFAAFATVCRHPLVYNGDLTTPEEIAAVQERFPMLHGIMIGRGLLANPALAIEYKTKKPLSTEEMRAKLRQMHRMVFDHYEQRIEGGEAQLLNKMKAFWEYLEPQIGRKAWKAIHKCTSLAKYHRAVEM